MDESLMSPYTPKRLRGLGFGSGHGPDCSTQGLVHAAGGDPPARPALDVAVRSEM